MIAFDQQVCSDLGQTLEREWIETNGLGGFASSTIAGVNTRRYHGLLTAAITPPTGRCVLLSKMEETLVVEGRGYELSANLYPGAVHPQGYSYLKQFRLYPFPVFTYQVEGLEIEKRIFMAHGENTTVIEYELHSLDRDPLPECILELRPLIAFRDYHSTTHANESLNPQVEQMDGMMSIQPYKDLCRLYIGHNASAVEVSGDWYRNFEYPEEVERGLDSREDLFQPLAAKFNLHRNATATVVASTEPRRGEDAAELRSSEIERRKRIADNVPGGEPLVKALAAAADQYIVRRGDQKTIIAGYHWFSDWGRDTMIALPGLTLVIGRPEIAKSLLLEFSRFVDRGMLPNRFPDAGETPEYNTVDATLWYFEAIRAYAAYTGDLEFVRNELYPVFTDIIAWHTRGTRYGIKVDPSGLLNSGEPGIQLTWMDA